MLRNKAKGISIALVTLMALTSVNFGVLNEFSLFTENAVIAQEEDRVLTEFKDPEFRKKIVDELNYLGRDDTPDIEVSSEYKYPIFNTDIRKMEEIESLNFENDEGEKIKSIEGIKHFKNLINLDLESNSIEEIDLSENYYLKTLNLLGNNIKNINLNKNTSLETLDLSGNSIEEINLSENTSLETLDLSGNSIEEINLSENTSLETLNLSGNNIKSIDLSENTSLETLNLSGNSIKSIDLSENTSLETLDLSKNSIEEIELSKNTSLRKLDLSSNNIKDIDLSENTSLGTLDLSKNSIEEINLSENTSLKTLDLSSNNIKDIDLSKNTSLGTLNLSNNSIEEINLSENTSLGTLNLSNNKLTSLNTENNKSLSTLHLASNNIEELNLSENKNIRDLNASDNKLKEINIDNIKYINYIDLSNNELKEIDLSKNTSIVKLLLKNNNIEKISIGGRNYDSMIYSHVDISGNSIGYFDMTRRTNSSAPESVILSEQTKKIIVESKEEFDLKEYLMSEMKEYMNRIPPYKKGHLLKNVSVKKEEGVEYNSEIGKVYLTEGKDSFTYILKVQTSENRLLNNKIVYDTEDMEVNIKLLYEGEEDENSGESGGSSGGSGSSSGGNKDDEPSGSAPKDETFVKGYEDGTFKPENSMTRAETAAMFTRLLEEGEENLKESGVSRSYIDISKGWYLKYIDYMVEKGIMNGYQDGTMKPDDTITRAEIAKMIAQCLENEGKETGFTDIEGHWAQKDIEKIFEAGITSGYPDGTFRPDTPVTRAEAAKMFNVFFDRGVDEEGLKTLENPEDLIEFTDLDKNHWGYYEIIEAANNHEFEKREGTRMENWIRIIK